MFNRCLIAINERQDSNELSTTRSPAKMKRNKAENDDGKIEFCRMLVTVLQRTLLHSEVWYYPAGVLQMFFGIGKSENLNTAN